MKLGFKDEGLNQMSYLENGKLCDRQLVNVIRSEVN
jgi:hypothetical protein